MNELKKDFIGQLSKLSPFIASVLIPLVLALIGNWISISLKDSENNMKMIEIAAKILEAKPDKEVKATRQWAISILKKHSTVPFPDELSQDLLTFSLPTFLAGTSNVSSNNLNPISNLASKISNTFLTSTLNSEERTFALERAKKGIRLIVEPSFNSDITKLTNDEVISLMPLEFKLMIKLGIVYSYHNHLVILSKNYEESLKGEDSDSALQRLNKGIKHAEDSFELLLNEIK